MQRGEEGSDEVARATKSQKILATISELDNSISESESLCIRIMGTDEKVPQMPDALQSNDSVSLLLSNLPEILERFSERIRTVNKEIEGALF